MPNNAAVSPAPFDESQKSHAMSRGRFGRMSFPGSSRMCRARRLTEKRSCST